MPIVESIFFGGIILVTVAAMAISRARPSVAAHVSAAAAAAVAGGFGFVWATGRQVALAPSWIVFLGSSFELRIDPLAAPLGVFAAGLAAVILVYTAGYLPQHLAEHGHEPRAQARFCQLVLAFMLTMLLLLCAQDLLVLFAALELTSLASFMLIDFDRSGESRRAAMVALAVTGGGSVFFAVGAVLVASEAGTTVLSEVAAQMPGGIGALPAALIVVGVIGKSAQVPLHFWLPRAMVAPTPVSAYLHSAALVAAGVFTLMRLRELFAAEPAVMTALQCVGLISILVGGALALVSDELKRILAYSTIAQYGYVAVLIALGGEKGLVGAPLFLVAHGLCKSALFLTAGAVTQATGAEKLSQAGGLGRTMPLLAGASAVSAAGLAGLPLTMGYFRDDLFFAAAVHDGPLMAVLAAAAAGMTFAYIGRFWAGLFLGAERAEGDKSSAWLTLPVVFLALWVVVGGLWTEPLRGAFVPAGEVVGARPLSVEIKYHLSARPETWMALGAWVSGALVLGLRKRWEAPLRRLTRGWVAYVSPDRWVDVLTTRVRRASDLLHQLELRDLRDRVGAVLLPTAVLVMIGFVARAELAMTIGPIGWRDAPVALALAVTACAAVAAARAVPHVTFVIYLSFVGFALALVFALSGMPDVALVVAIVETVFTILFLSVLRLIRGDVLGRVRRDARESGRGPWMGFIVGGAAFVLSWFALESPRVPHARWQHLELAEHAHAKDVVTAVLADFRGLDTAGELTVLAVGALGAAAISWERSTT